MSFWIKPLSITFGKLKSSTVDSINQQASVKNYVQNGDFRFFQRQVPGTLTSRQDDQYGPDRWYILNSGGAVNTQVARVAEVISTSPSPFVCQIRQADASSRQFGMAQILESDRSVELRGKTVTFSFWARTDGSEVGNLRAGIVEWTGTADSVTSDIVSSWSSTPTLIGSATFINTPADLALTSSMQQFSITVTLGSSLNNLVLFVWSTASEAQNDDFYLAQPQLVVGSVAMPWSLIRVPVAVELKELERFYQKSYNIDLAPGDSSSSFGGTSTFFPAATSFEITTFFKSRFRTAPSVAYYSPVTGAASNFRDRSGNVDVASGSMHDIGEHAMTFQQTSGVSINRIYSFHWTGDAEL